jgi:hypothetical protein
VSARYIQKQQIKILNIFGEKNSMDFKTENHFSEIRNPTQLYLLENLSLPVKLFYHKDLHNYTFFYLLPLFRSGGSVVTKDVL